MVRIIPATDSSSSSSSSARCPLYLSARSDTGAPILQLRVDRPEWWHLSDVTVLHTPDDQLVGSQHAQLGRVMGRLKKYLPQRVKPHDYIEVLHAYVVGPLDEQTLGKERIPFEVYGKQVSTRHSPGHATTAVHCLRDAPAAGGGGRWLPVSVLRPFVPAGMGDAEAAQQLARRMGEGAHIPNLRRQIREARRGQRTVAAYARQVLGPEAAVTNPPLATGSKRPASTMPTAAQAEGDGADGTPKGAEEVPGVEPGVKPAAVGCVEMQPERKKKRRQTWTERMGNVVLLRPEATRAAGRRWPVFLVITGKEEGPPRPPCGSKRYLRVQPVPRAPAGGATELWHVSDVEALDEALPRLVREHLETDGAMAPGERRRLGEAIVAAVEAQHERAKHAVGIEEVWARLCPAGGAWGVLRLHLGA